MTTTKIKRERVARKIGLPSPQALKKERFLLIRLVRLALGHPIIKKQLRTDQHGVFSIDLIKWKQIMDRIEKEELESILAQGLEDI